MCLAQGQNTDTPMRLEPAAPRSRVKHSTTRSLCSQPPPAPKKSCKNSGPNLGLNYLTKHISMKSKGKHGRTLTCIKTVNRITNRVVITNMVEHVPV